MTTWRTAFAIGLVRAWTRVYTSGVPTDVRTRRCAEIDSDLWECQQDPDDGRALHLEVQVLLRLLRGAPHDLCWRLEQADTPRTRSSAVGLVAASSIVAIVLAALWILPLLRPATLPPPAPSAWLRASSSSSSSSCAILP